MNFFRIVLISILFIFTSNLAMADNHTKEQDIIDKAKEINKKINQKNRCRKKISLITRYQLDMKLKAISLDILNLKDKSLFLKRC